MLEDVTYGGGIYVTVGRGGVILTSPNGISWTSRSSGTSNNLKGVAYGDGQFVAVKDYGEHLTSTDGIDWVLAGTSEEGGSVAYGNGQFVIGSVDLIFGYDIWVKVGQNGNVWVSSDGGPAYISNGLNWEWRYPGTPANFLSVAVGDNNFVVVGSTNDHTISEANIVTSYKHGSNWQILPSTNFPESVGGTTLRDITSEPGPPGQPFFVTVGEGGTIWTSQGCCGSGLTWVSRSSGTNEALFGVTCKNC